MPNYDGVTEDSDRMLLDIESYKPFLIEEKYGIVIDCGANVGHFTNFIKDKSEKVYAIEPATRNYERIRDGANVYRFNRAIAGSNAPRPLYQGGSWGGFSLTNKHPIIAEEVECQTLATFIKEQGIKKVGLLKIDVEGAEDEIFNAPDIRDALPKLQRIIGEAHAGSQVVKILSSHGFTVVTRGEVFYAERIL